MKKLIIAFVLLFTVSTAFTSCRDQKSPEEKIEEAMDEVGDEIENAADDVKDAAEDLKDEIEEAAVEVEDTINNH